MVIHHDDDDDADDYGKRIFTLWHVFGKISWWCPDCTGVASILILGEPNVLH